MNTWVTSLNIVTQVWFSFYFLGGVLVRFGTLTGACWLESGVSVALGRIFFCFLPVRLSVIVQLLIEYNRFFWGCLEVLFNEQGYRNLA
jgi:hypothetical protein